MTTQSNGAVSSGEGASKKKGFKERVTDWALNNLPFLFCVLRVVKPILVFRKFALVTRFADVDEVMHRDDAFMVTYAEKMRVVTDGSNFFLGMGPGPDYSRDSTNMRAAAPIADAGELVVPLVSKYANDIVEPASGGLDAVADLTKVVPAQLVEEYIGISGPTREDLIEWTTSLFYFLFFPSIPEESVQAAHENGARARKHIDEIIATRKNSSEEKNDMLGRLLKLQAAGVPGLTDVDIRNNLLGIIIGAIPTTSKASALVLDYLLDNPEIMAQAREVAQRGDVETLNRYVLESLRLKPVAFSPGLFRECVQDYRIAKGSWRSKTIRKGTQVFVATQSAMLDGREVKRPRKFEIERPEYQYMPYGFGMHQCFGKYINDVQIALIVGSLISKPGLKRAEGPAGQLQSDSRSFPIHLGVTF